MPPHGSMIQLFLHYAITECRPVLLLYLAARTYLKNVVIYDLTSGTRSAKSEIMFREVINMTAKESLQSYLECTRTEGEEALYSLQYGDYSGKCIHVPATMRHRDMLLNYGVLVVCCSYICFFTILLYRSGVSSIGQGKYLQWTRSISKRTIHKVFTEILMLLIIVVVCRHILSLANEFWQGETRQAAMFLELYGSEALLLAYSAYIIAAPVPAFHWKAEFQNLQFQRGWMSVLNQRNEAFFASLQSALLKAKHGHTEDLQSLLDGNQCSSVDEVVRACQPYFEDTESDSTEDEAKLVNG